MRLRYFAPGDEAETAFLLSQLAGIDDFWRQFKKLAKPNSREGTWLPQLREALNGISPELGLEVQREEAGTLVLYILPLVAGPSAILARAITERAPSVLPWSFAVWRPPVSLDKALEIVRQDCGIDLSQARARVGVGRGHAIEVVIGSHLFGGTEDPEARQAAERLVNALLGDEVFEQWVTEVRITRIPRPGPLRVVGQEDATLPLAIRELGPAVFAARHGIASGLPERPYHHFCEQGEWLLFEVGDLRGPESKPEEAQEFSAEGVEAEPLLHQEDLLLATTMCPEMLRCLLTGSPFASARFSRHGEVFCYLKLSLPGEQEERVERRVALEEVLDRALVPGGLGCVVGSGVGERYMYINLCLHNTEPALRLVVARLRSAQVLPESWVLFCDAELAEEWIGVWEETPAPGWLSTHSSTFLDVFH